MKLLFLDFDGVIITEDSRKQGSQIRRRLYGGWFASNDQGGSEYNFDSDLIRRVNNICISTGTEVVISSQWRIYSDAKNIPYWLSDRGLTATIITNTPHLEEYDDDGNHNGLDRADEIEVILNRYKPTNFVILDDMAMAGRLHPENFIYCNPVSGITALQAAQAIQILNR